MTDLPTILTRWSALYAGSIDLDHEYPDAIRERLREAVEDIHGLVREVERLRALLHRDETGLVHGLVKVERLASSWNWATEGRGAYAWNDERYRDEFARALTAIRQAAVLALHQSGKRADAAFRSDAAERDANACAVCGFRLSAKREDGCVRGDCSMRPRPAVLYDPGRAAQESTPEKGEG